MRYLLVSETSSEKCDMQQDSERAKDNKMSSKSEKRISVTFSDCFNIPDAPGSKSSLSKKYIFSHIYHPRRDLHNTILWKRSQEELLEQLTVSLGHVECRHAHYPATPPVYRSEKIVNPVSAASGLLDFSSLALKHLHLAFDLEYPEESKTSKKF